MPIGNKPRVLQHLAPKNETAAVDRQLQQALVLHRAGRLDEAEQGYLAILGTPSVAADALHLLGLIRQARKQLHSSIQLIRASLLIRPQHADAHYNLGALYQASRQPLLAIESYRRALALNPEYPAAYINLGSALLELKRYDEAIDCYRKLLVVRPDHIDAYNNLGFVLQDMRRYDEAIECYRKALEIDPNYAAAWNNLGNIYQAQHRLSEAIECYRRLLTLQPDHPNALGMLADCELKACNWSETERLKDQVIAHVRQQKTLISPFTLLGYSDSPAEQLQCAQTLLRHKIPVLPKPLCGSERYRRDRIRVAYLSADFDRHATAYLMAELFELHDRNRFEVIGISFGPDDQSAMRARLVMAFDRFHDVRALSDADAAKLVRSLEVDIAVDLKGHTQDARPGIFAWRPAPIQVSYLGYPGTTGADFIDYVVADKWVLPFDQQPFYSEKIVHLPDCYQVNDGKRTIAPGTPGRAECGLPEQGFVFCCFNGNYKITPEVFAIWMRLLKKVDGSVLWLLRDNDIAERNLKRAAQAAGVDAARLVFAPRAPLEHHLARHRLADLFIDTLPVNAHTTASDALWAGLPVLTCIGKAFAGRVAASLLYTIGLPELVTDDLMQYENAALQLAGDPQRLLALRARLQQNRNSSALFDTDRYRRHLEIAYRMMWEAWQRGEPPAAFPVPSLT
jgi:protein O-GlcNAc transferase